MNLQDLCVHSDIHCAHSSTPRLPWPQQSRMGAARQRILLSLATVLLFLSASVIGLKPPKQVFNGAFTLERLSQTYLPSYYSGEKPKFCLGSGTAEQVAYDAKQQVMYVVGYKIVHVMDMEYPEAPIIVGHLNMQHDITDVATCGDMVAVTETAGRRVEPGFVHIFQTFDHTSEKDSLMKRLFKIQVGSQPDMLRFSEDCQRILVANEGEPGKDYHGKFVDPEGSVSIISIEALYKEGGTIPEAVNTIEFRGFNQHAESLAAKGVRWVFRNRPESYASSFSKNMEPEYVALSEDGKTAYVCLQENNAVAVIDLEKEAAVSIIPLGLKAFERLNSRLDASDRDNGPHLRSWPVFSTYQPDAIASFNHNGEDYIVTANEGDPKVFDDRHGVEYFTDMSSGGGISWHMSHSTSHDLLAALRDESMLSRVSVSDIDGWADEKENGKRVRDKVVLFGARSFSIFRARDMKPVFDSHDDLEALTADLFPWSFNSMQPEKFCLESPYEEDINVDSRNYFNWLSSTESDKPPKPSRKPFMDSNILREKVANAKRDLENYQSVENPEDHNMHRPTNALTSSPSDLTDKTSKLSGCSPESLVLGIVDGRRLLFLATEKGGAIFVYDISDPKAPVWHSAIYPGQHTSTWAELYNEKKIIDVDPEGMVFVPSHDSPSGDPLLLVSGSLSGTVSVYKIKLRLSSVRPHLVLQSPKAIYKKPVGESVSSHDGTTSTAVNADLN